jgi:ribosomal protein S18 acetylase RimI-like enzyme
VRAFYEHGYPGNWFVARMLETGLYKGVRRGDQWLALGGVHVYSATRGIAALGNIATHPSHRRRGLATSVTAALCLDLASRVKLIGLNVHAENHAAIACYGALGFKRVADYDELSLERVSYHPRLTAV